MRFGRLDLNLLVALDVLLTERNVSIAADRLFLSQSAVSGALGRLREYFGDELLVNTGRKMVLTSRGESLLTPVRNILLQIKTTINTTPEFVPIESDRNFSIVMSDYSLQVMMAGALRHISTLAPNLTFDISPIAERPIIQLESREIDLLVTIDQAVSEQHPKATLFTDDYVVIAWDQNSAIGLHLDQTKYSALGHVTVQFGKARLSTLEEYFLQTLKIKRRIEMFAPSFTSVPGLVVGTNRVATVHRRMAMKAAADLPLKLYEVPAEMPKVTQVIQWHTSASNDQALMWVVDQIQAYAQGRSFGSPRSQISAVAE